MNFELSTHDANFGFNEERVARHSAVSVWAHETEGKMERFNVESCMGGYHIYKAQTLLVLAYLDERYWPRFGVVLVPCSLLCSLPPSPHAGLFGILRIKGTVNMAQIAKKNVARSKR